MKIAITGNKGMLGTTLTKVLGKDHQIIGIDLPEHDITDLISLEKFIVETQPQIIIHCAAMTNVDLCEEEKDKCFTVNHLGSKNLAIICNRYNIKLIAFSTDYIFDGRNDLEYIESSFSNPLNIYGKSKLAGEKAIERFCTNYIIFRIAWLYGQNGPSFVHTMLKLFKSNTKDIKVVNDQIGTPTSTVAVANKVKYIIENRRDVYGIVHLSCQGYCSWYDFAFQIWNLWNRDDSKKCPLIPVNTYDYKAAIAIRPKHSVLRNLALREYKIQPMPNWKDAIQEFLKDVH